MWFARNRCSSTRLSSKLRAWSTCLTDRKKKVRVDHHIPRHPYINVPKKECHNLFKNETTWKHPNFYAGSIDNLKHVIQLGVRKYSSGFQKVQKFFLNKQKTKQWENILSNCFIWVWLSLTFKIDDIYFLFLKGTIRKANDPEICLQKIS